MENTGVIILAAGEGTRMKSDRAKVLHEMAGVPMIRYVVETALAVTDVVVVVVGYQAETVREALTSYPSLRFALQKEQLGTGHAVVCALPEIPERILDVVVLCGDTPLIEPNTVRGLIQGHRAGGGALSLITTTLENPSGYGRIVLDSKGKPMRIVEEADATEAEKRICAVNTGAYCVNRDFLKRALHGLTQENAQGEFYLTDVVGQAYRDGVPAALFEVEDSNQVLGVNTKAELTRASQVLSDRMKQRD
jgi:UDP-N-acetylglucosamine diphosphorylase/glucosamine-1-phosphate N-acetyltransferase